MGETYNNATVDEPLACDPTVVAAGAQALKNAQQDFVSSISNLKALSRAKELQKTKLDIDEKLIERIKNVIDSIAGTGNEIVSAIYRAVGMEDTNLSLADLFFNYDEIEFINDRQHDMNDDRVTYNIADFFGKGDNSLDNLIAGLESGSEDEKNKAIETLRDVISTYGISQIQSKWETEGAGTFRDYDWFSQFLEEAYEYNNYENQSKVEYLVSLLRTNMEESDFWEYLVDGSDDAVEEWKNTHKTYEIEAKHNDSVGFFATEHGFAKFFESIGDAFVLLGSYTPMYQSSMKLFMTEDELKNGDINEIIKDKTASLVAKDITNDAMTYVILNDDSWKNSHLLANQDLAYGGEGYWRTVQNAEQTTNTIVTTAANFIPSGGSVISALIGSARGVGQTTEQALNHGADYDTALLAGTLRGTSYLANVALDRVGNLGGIIGSSVMNGAEAGCDMLNQALTNSIIYNTDMSTEIDKLGGWKSIAGQTGIGTLTSLTMSLAATGASGQEFDWFGMNSKSKNPKLEKVEDLRDMETERISPTDAVTERVNNNYTSVNSEEVPLEVGGVTTFSFGEDIETRKPWSHYAVSYDDINAGYVRGDLSGGDLTFDEAIEASETCQGVINRLNDSVLPAAKDYYSGILDDSDLVQNLNHLYIGENQDAVVNAFHERALLNNPNAGKPNGTRAFANNLEGLGFVTNDNNSTELFHELYGHLSSDFKGCALSVTEAQSLMLPCNEAMIQATATKAMYDYATKHPEVVAELYKYSDVPLTPYPTISESGCAYQLGANAINQLNNTGDELGLGLTDSFRRAGVEGLENLRVNGGGVTSNLTPSQTEWITSISDALPNGKQSTSEFFRYVGNAANVGNSLWERELSYDMALDLIDEMQPRVIVGN